MSLPIEITCEPSFKNLELLARNIRLNSLQEHITIISNPLTEKFLVSKYFQGDFKAGAAEASFDNKGYVKEHEIKNKHTIMNKEKIFYNTLGISIDNLIDKNLIDLPKLIKIDVDGNEIEILNRCTNFLEKAKKISILIETRPETENVSPCLGGLCFLGSGWGVAGGALVLATFL